MILVTKLTNVSLTVHEVRNLGLELINEEINMLRVGLDSCNLHLHRWRLLSSGVGCAIGGRGGASSDTESRLVLNFSRVSIVVINW